ncbi:MAG: hypothetical protein KDB14_20490 [Planctomycetales bacterium]|nr:hypothetical protein [Planctomycetales bacterium]
MQKQKVVYTLLVGFLEHIGEGLLRRTSKFLIASRIAQQFLLALLALPIMCVLVHLLFEAIGLLGDWAEGAALVVFASTSFGFFWNHIPRGRLLEQSNSWTCYDARGLHLGELSVRSRSMADIPINLALLLAVNFEVNFFFARQLDMTVTDSMLVLGDNVFRGVFFDFFEIFEPIQRVELTRLAGLVQLAFRVAACILIAEIVASEHVRWRLCSLSSQLPDTTDINHIKAMNWLNVAITNRQFAREFPHERVVLRLISAYLEGDFDEVRAISRRFPRVTLDPHFAALFVDENNELLLSGQRDIYRKTYEKFD